MTTLEQQLTHMFEQIGAAVKRPALFEKSTVAFWDEPYISEQLLAAHLNPETDGASRTLATIEKTVAHLTETGLLKPDDHVLDLGCGPGLYCSRLSQFGVRMTGIDFSRRSIEYARSKAQEQGLAIDYVHGNFFDINYDEAFDSVLQVYGELCTFSDEERDRLLRMVHKALKQDGLFIFDVSTRALRKREGLKNSWRWCEGGLWYSGRHIVFEQGFDYPEVDTWVDQYTILREDGVCRNYHMWFHDYSLHSIAEVLARHGFRILQRWNSLTGEAYKDGGDWIALAAQKI